MSGRKYRYAIRSREVEGTTVWDVVDRVTGKIVSPGWTTKGEAFRAARTFEHQGEMGKR